MGTKEVLLTDAKMWISWLYKMWTLCKLVYIKYLEYKTTITNGIICRVCLGTVYSAKIENFLLKVL